MSCVPLNHSPQHCSKLNILMTFTVNEACFHFDRITNAAKFKNLPPHQILVLYSLWDQDVFLGFSAVFF